MKNVRLGVAVVSFLILASWISQTYFSPPPRPPDPIPVESPEEPSADDLRGEVWTMAKKLVAERLKAPGAARFPERWAEGVDIKTGEQSTVKGYVDGKNELGGEKRIPWTVVLTRKPDGRYRVDEVTLKER